MIQQPSNSTSDRPFPAQPCVDRYFAASSIEDARQRVTRCIERGDGPALIVGASGTGKTLLMGVLAEQFADRFDVAMLACAQLCTRRVLLQAILFELNLPYRYHVEGELRLTLLDHLLRSQRCRNGMLLLVDEAQSLPLRLLEEIRLMSNLVRNGQPRVRLVLAGSPLLEETFAAAELESFQQRLASRCYLAPMNRAETAEYIRAQLAASGLDPQRVFLAEALDAVFDATDGVPRLVNQVCDRALLLAGETATDTLGRSHVQAAWADLQQLPTPWETEPTALASSPASSVIEFGQLSDVGVAEVPDEPVESAAPFGPALGPDWDEPPQTAEWEHEDLLEPTTLDENDEEIGGWSPDAGESNEPQLEPALVAVRTEDASAAGEAVDTPVADGAGDEALARDPFGEDFAEEEIVLEEFAALGEVFRVETPRVAEQSTGGHMSTLVRQILDVAERRAHATGPEGPPSVDLKVDIETDEDRVALETVPLITLTTAPSAVGVDTFDPVYPDDEMVVVEEVTNLAAAAATIRYPGVEDAASKVAASPRDDCDVVALAPEAEIDEPSDETDSLEESFEDDVLIVEDFPADSAAGMVTVRRQDYSQLFANLRRQS